MCASVSRKLSTPTREPFAKMSHITMYSVRAQTLSNMLASHWLVGICLALCTVSNRVIHLSDEINGCYRCLVRIEEYLL